MKHGTLSSLLQPAVRYILIPFLHAEGQSTDEFMAPGNTIKLGVYCETLNQPRRLIQNKRRGMITKGVILLHDNARSHSVACTNASIKIFNWEIFKYPPNSLDLVPSNYNLLTNMKIWLATQCLHTNEGLMDGVTNGCITWQHCSLMRDYII